MKRLLIILLTIALLSATAYAGQQQAAAVLARNNAATGVTPFFEADWSTNSPGADDEKCEACSGCSASGATYDEWDNFSDGGGFCSVSGGRFVCVVTAATNDGFVNIDDDATEVLNGQSITEFWVEFVFKIDNVSNLKTNWSLAIFQWYQTNDGVVRIYTNGSGEIDGISILHPADAGDQETSEVAWSPVADTDYTIRIHWKRDTDGGAGGDVGNDGVASITVVGVGTQSNTGVDSDTEGDNNRKTQVGNLANAYDGSNSYAVSIDDFRFYTTDPGW